MTYRQIPLSQRFRFLSTFRVNCLQVAQKKADIFPPDVQPSSFGYYTKIKVTKLIQILACKISIQIPSIFSSLTWHTRLSRYFGVFRHFLASLSKEEKGGNVSSLSSPGSPRFLSRDEVNPRPQGTETRETLGTSFTVHVAGRYCLDF